MNSITFNNGALRLSALGLGCMGMSDFYGPADRAESLRTLHAALDAGVTLLDTADFYGSGHNEMLIAEALKTRRREDVFISVKFGVLRDPAGGFLGADLRPDTVKNSLAQTLRRLGTDYVDLYMPARLVPGVPLADTIGAMADMVKAGYVRHIGLSEAGASSLRAAQAIHPIAALQIEYSLLSRGIEADILPAARAMGIGILAYGVLSRGLLSGHWSLDRQAQTHDFRAHLPRFQAGGNLERNLALVERLAQIAREKNATVAQIAIAWVMAQNARTGAAIMPLVGARRRERLQESLGALDVQLTTQDLARLESILPADAVAGARYPDAQMQWLDSERR